MISDRIVMLIYLLNSNRVLLTAIKSGDPSAIERAMEIHAEEERLFPKDKLFQASGNCKQKE
jgi:hypothetical protein